MPDDAGHLIRPEPTLDLVAGRSARDADAEGGLRRAREWAEANRKTIDAVNKIIREHGAFGDEALDRW